MASSPHPMRRALSRALASALVDARGKVDDARDAFDETTRAADYRADAEALERHRHLIPRRADTVSLPDPASPDGMRTVLLDPYLKPADNIRRYRKWADRLDAERAPHEEEFRRATARVDVLTRLSAAYDDWGREAPPDLPPPPLVAEATERAGVHVPGLLAAATAARRGGGGAGALADGAVELTARLAPLFALDGGAGGKASSRPSTGGENPIFAKDDAVQTTSLQSDMLLSVPETPDPDEASLGAVARKFRTVDGRVVWVGRSASDNDVLSIRLARGGDGWLHVAHQTGSHVLIRVGSGGEEISRESWLDAAHLAVYYSKARHGARVGVDYTRARHVRKERGSPAGQVVLSRHETMTVRMEEGRLARLGVEG